MSPWRGIMTLNLCVLVFKQFLEDVSDVYSGFQSQGGSLMCFLACVILRFTSGADWWGQHGSQAFLINILAGTSRRIGGGSGLEPATVCAASTALYAVCVLCGEISMFSFNILKQDTEWWNTLQTSNLSERVSFCLFFPQNNKSQFVVIAVEKKDHKKCSLRLSL